VVGVQIHIYGWWIWMYYANPVSYAFQGLASNEFWGREYSCTDSELMPPTSVPNFNLPYPDGFDGTSYRFTPHSLAFY
jgi:ABC-type multidrug transport system permease subunit